MPKCLRKKTNMSSEQTTSQKAVVAQQLEPHTENEERRLVEPTPNEEPQTDNAESP